jgi:hypothetical protein
MTTRSRIHLTFLIRGVGFQHRTHGGERHWQNLAHLLHTLVEERSRVYLEGRSTTCFQRHQKVLIFTTGDESTYV